MNKVERRIDKLLNILCLQGYVTIKELSASLGVSEMTVRRDVKKLEADSVIKNSNGTLVYCHSNDGNHEDRAEDRSYELEEEEDRHRSAKERIGRFAASLVEADDIIIIDTGTTTVKITPFLPSDKNLTALCYNFNILKELYDNPGINLMFAGGYYYANTQMFASEFGVQFVRSIRAQKVFVSAAGIHRELGLTCANAYEVPTKKAILNSSMHKILVTDSSKFGNVRSSYFCDLGEIHEIVTDSALSDDWRDVIHEVGIKLHIV